jgi:hypothetical protein
MMILLSQLFSPATLVASVLFAPESDGALLVRASSSAIWNDHSAPAVADGSSLLDTNLGLLPIADDRPYAL